MGIEPTQPAWKAGTLPLSYTRALKLLNFNPTLKPQYSNMVEGVGFEPTYTTWADLQSAAINHSATPPSIIASGDLSNIY